jgi:hypothetical protein
VCINTLMYKLDMFVYIFFYTSRYLIHLCILFVTICIYMYICIQLYLYICIYIRIYALCMHIFICILIYVYIILPSVPAPKRRHLVFCNLSVSNEGHIRHFISLRLRSTALFVYIYIFIFICIYICMYIYVYTYIHI